MRVGGFSSDMGLDRRWRRQVCFLQWQARCFVLVLLFSCSLVMSGAWFALIHSDSWQHPGFAPYWPILRRLREQAAAEPGRARATTTSVAASADGLAIQHVHQAASVANAVDAVLTTPAGLMTSPTKVQAAHAVGDTAIDPAEVDGWHRDDWLDALNRLAAWRGLVNARRLPLRFVPGEDASALDYERRIHEAGEIACRAHGAGARHDFHNALVWLRFPRLKGAFNQLHCEQGAQLSALFATGGTAGEPHQRVSGQGPALDQVSEDVRAKAQGRGGRKAAGLPPPSGRKGRGYLRDAITLLDEGGAIWPAPATLWVEALQARQWQRLFGQYRPALDPHFAPVIIGHGLLEKLHRPYKSMTAKLLICTSPRAGLDRGAALQVRDMASRDIFRPRMLVPMPIQGWPGWDPANEDPAFYEDVSVFRSPR